MVALPLVSTTEVMHMGSFVDFNELKGRVSIEEAVSRLGMKVVKSANQLRGACPSCKTGGDRALAITPAKSLFYCFAAQAGGDQIALVSHIQGSTVREAAEWLGGTVQDTENSTSTVSKERTTPPAPGFQALDYLESDHPAVEAVGFDKEAAEAIGLGFAPKGVLKGTVALPLRLPDGTLIGYVGVTEARIGKLHLPEKKVVAFPKKMA